MRSASACRRSPASAPGVPRRRNAGLGGTAPTQLPPQNLSLGDFSEKLLTLARQVESRNDMLGVLEAQLFEQAVKKKMIPTMMPVRGPYNASGFGRRIDPFNGQWAMHDGIDFIAEYGSPIVAAAAGVVVFSGFHPQYGYMVDIDHGNDLVTRYAHCSKLVVREGDLVQRAQDRRSRLHRPFDRSAPALRSALPRRAAEPPSSWCRTPTPPWRGPSKFQLESVVEVERVLARVSFHRQILKLFNFLEAAWRLPTRIFGSRNERLLKQYAFTVARINASSRTWPSCPMRSCAARPRR